MQSKARSSGFPGMTLGFWLSVRGAGTLAKQFRLLSLVVGVVVGLQPPVALAATVGKDGSALSAEAISAIESLQAEKASRSPLHRKLDSQLVYALRAQRGLNGGGTHPHHRPRFRAEANGRILVDIRAEVSPALLQACLAEGGKLVSSVPELRSLRVELPLGAIERLAGRPDVKRIRPAAEAVTNAGSVDSEGNITHGATDFRNRYQVDGTGVKVGVLSDSLDFLPEVMLSGNLPDIHVIPGQAGSGSGEGTAMLEIVHDLAPGAELHFATALAGEAVFAENIRRLYAAGCRVLIDDVTYFNESPFQDGLIAQAVAEVCAGGALFFSSAGNSGNKNDGSAGTWEGDFNDGGATSIGRGGRLHRFGDTTFNTVLSGGGFRRVDLFWSDPMDHSTNDYDVYVLDSAGRVVASSTNIQDGDDDPYESINTLNIGDRVVVVKQRGADRFLSLTTGRARLAVSTGGNVRGHNAAGAANAFSVAAAWVGAQPTLFTPSSVNQVELFSSDGPRRIFFTASGVPITPGNFSSTGGQVLLKPDITAADGVATATPDFQPFFGTSAAAPHAGAIAALIWSYNPALSPAEVRQALLSTALDIEAPGVDPNAGYGLVMPEAAVAAVSQPAPRFSLEAVHLQDANGNGHLDANECADLTVDLRNLLALTGQTATGVVATLVSSDPQVVVDPAPRTFGDLFPQISVANPAPFRISTKDFPSCDRPIHFVLQVSAENAAPAVFPFTIETQSPGSSPAFVRSAVDLPQAIPDLAEVTSRLQVNDLPSPIARIDVELHLLHTYVSDLIIELTGPDGTRVALAANQGGSGSDYGLSCNQVTRFSDSAANRLGSGSPPFVGSFKPEVPLEVFRGKSGAQANGTWSLTVRDIAENDTGLLVCWSLDFRLVECSDGGGRCLVAPSLTQVPNAQLRIAGESAVFQVAAQGTEPLSYQWYHDGNLLPGATSSSLEFASVSSTDAGLYFVRVANPYGSADSPSVALEVMLPPRITRQPTGLSVAAGGNAAFYVGAAGSEPLRYQWLRGGLPLLDQTNAALRLAGVLPPDEGEYRVQVSSPFGSAISDVAVLKVFSPPAIVSLPTELSVTNGDPASFAVGVTGTQPLTFFWFRNQQDWIPQAVGPTLLIPSTGPGDAGQYSVVVSNLAGVVTSPGATLHVLEEPHFVLSPTNQVLALGGAARLVSLAVGDPVPSYQWYRTVFELADVIPDATNATLHIEPLGFADSARYFVVASNLLGVVTSEVAQVQVLALPLITRQPDSQHLVTGSPALFTVLATGEGPFTYQWYFNGANLLAGETAAELHLPAVGPSQAGRYRVVVGNLVGEVSSEEAVLAVGERVSVAQQPVSVAAPRAGMASFSVVASGEPPFTYQWFFGDAVPVAGATGPSLTLSNLSLSEAGDYTVVVANFAGSQTSQVARLEVLDPPGFLVQPASRTGIVGATITLTAEAEGTPPLFLQWFREGGLAVPGATSAQLELVSVQSLDGGGYYLEVSNRVGRIRSDTAQVDVISPPQLSGIGGARAVALGGVLHLTALVDGTPPFEFVWLDEDAEIPGQTGAELILTGLTFDQAGAYRVRVTNPAGVALSSPVSVAVLQAPVITIPPRPQVIAVGDTLTLTALAEGAEPLEYRWMFNTNTPIPSATGPVLVLENIQPSQQGTYQFVVSNAVGVAVSPHVRVRVQEPPVILSQPADQTVPRGTTAHFQVQATGTGPLRFSWFFNELQLVEDATNALLTLSNVSSNQAGSYQVVAQNEVGSVTSQVARLVVKEVPLILTQPVGTTVVQGGEAQFSVLAVGPGVLRYQWMFAGIFALPDQTNATLVLSEVQPGLAGDYSVEVSNDEGSVSSSLAHLIVVVPPSITQQPEDRLAPVGGHAEFTVRAIGSAPLTVQWFFNETLAISGGTNGTLRLENLTPVESGPYFAVVSNVAGSITSRLASLSVLAPPVITQPPLPQRTVVGQPATFQVGAEGAEPLAFRWLHNGLELPGDVTQRVLQLPAVSAADSGSYAVRVSNAVGAVTSAPVTLTLLTPPFVTLPQTEDYRPVGGDFELEAEVGGTAPFTFQWLFFATNVLADATNAVLQLHDLAEAQSGIYQVVVANEAGVVTSTEFVLNVVQPPTVVAPPADLAVVEGETAVFQVEAAGYEPLSYQWLGPDAAPLPGATSPVLQLSNVTPSDAGHYSVQVSNRVGMVMSTSAELVVLMTPRFVVQPQGRTVARGGTGQFAVQATGTEPIYYQWFYEGNVPLDHQTNTILALDSVELAQAGQYFVRASNVAGVAMSEVAVLTVLEPPTIVRHPASLSVAQGQPATFRVLAEGAEPLSYQWFRDGAIELPGAVSSELILTEAQVEMAGDYSVRVSNPVGTILSEAARLGVVVPPAIVTSPTNVFSPVGGRAEFHVSVTGSEPLAFQWVYQATNALPDATNRSLVLTDLRAEQSGPYSVVVANAAGAVRSEEANLSVKEPPRILSHPASQRLLVGETARFEVVAAGDETLHYRWFGPNAAPLPGATLPVLEVPEVTGLQAGEYWVEVSNEVGVAISDAARLEVDSPPILVAEPLDLLAARGGNAQLEVQAAGAQPLTYQWLLFETNVLTDATNSVLAWEHVDYTNAGRYRVSVANPFGVTISREVEVQVLERPSVITLSSDLSVIAGQPARFVVEAGGDGPFSYQWFREGSGPIADATESSLTLPGVMPADAGRYFVEVSNPVGSVESQRATLEVWVPPTVIVPPQDLVLPVGAAASFQVTTGGTEPLFYQWFLNGATVLVDQTNRSLLLPPVALEDAGIYSVSVSNQAGVLLSSAQLRVLEPPTIRSSPGSLVVATGAVVRLEVQAGGSEPLTYQWYADGGIPIPGATQPVLLIESAGVPDAGRYSVEVGNEVGVVSSLPATLQVLVPPYLRSEPSDLTVMSGSDAELSAEVGGDPELHLQWYFFASNAIPDAITSTLRLLAVSVADSGDYVLTVSNAVGGIVSRTVRLTVLDPPLIGTIPLSLTLAQGEDARFEVLASGSALHYQWFKDGTTQIPGATGPVLLLPQVQLTDVGSYSVVISNAVGLAASPAASLRVLVPANILSFSNDEGVAAISFFSYKSLRYTLENADGLFGPWRVSSGSLRRKGTDGVITLYDVPPPSSRNRYFRILVE